MELDDIKSKWSELDERLGRTEEKMQQMAAKVSMGKFTSAKRRLMWICRIQLIVLLLLPNCFISLFRILDNEPQLALYVSMMVFVGAMIIRQLILIYTLSRIYPVAMTVMEAGKAIFRFRKYMFIGLAAGIVLAIPMFIFLGIFVAGLGLPYVMESFIIGLTLGMVLGGMVFMRKLEQINALSRALKSEE